MGCCCCKLFCCGDDPTLLDQTFSASASSQLLLENRLPDGHPGEPRMGVGDEEANLKTRGEDDLAATDRFTPGEIPILALWGEPTSDLRPGSEGSVGSFGPLSTRPRAEEGEALKLEKYEMVGVDKLGRGFLPLGDDDDGGS